MQKLNRLLSPESTPTWLKLAIDLAALAWIGWFAWQHAGFLLRDDLYLYGDHPGQFYRLWQLLEVVWAEDGWFIGWSPYWYAGYPELQFYPPGFALVGWLIWMGSFQQLSSVAVYQTVVFISFIFPAITFYILMARGLGDRLAGLAAAWLAMMAPFALGGARGVLIGLIGERLAFGLMPVLILASLWLMRARRKPLPWFVTGVILASIMVLHPYQAILPTAALGLYALFRGQGWQLRLRWLVYAVLLGFGLTAFWWLPFGVRHDFFIPLIEAPLPEISSNLADMWLGGMLWLLLAALLGAISRQGRRRRLPLAIYLTGSAMLGFIFVDHFVLVERLNIFALDPVRLITGVTFALIAALAMGLSELSWLGTRLLQRRSLGWMGLPLVVIIPWFIMFQLPQEYDIKAWLGPWQPDPHRTPLFLSEAEAKYGLSEVWEKMADTPGRILFTSHYGLLFDIPTSLKAATPYLTGKEIIGGTFTHRTPVGSYLWTGQAYPPVLRGKVEHQDDKSLAGVGWPAMNDEHLFNLVRQLNITLIVTTAIDRQAQAYLDSSPRFNASWSNGLFTLYEPIDYVPTWAEGKQAAAAVNRYGRTAIDVQITDAAPAAALTVKVANYALWNATIEGHQLPIETDDHGLMTLALPPGSYTIHLRYQPGWAEWLGGIITLMTFVAALGIVFYDWSRSRTDIRPQSPRDDESDPTGETLGI